MIWLGMLLAGLGLAVFARMTGIRPAIVVLGLVGVPLAAVDTAWSPLLMGAAPREYLGRVMSVLSPAMQLASIVSILAPGGWRALSWWASTRGRRVTIELLYVEGSLGGPGPGGRWEPLEGDELRS